MTDLEPHVWLASRRDITTGLSAVQLSSHESERLLPLLVELAGTLSDGGQVNCVELANRLVAAYFAYYGGVHPANLDNFNPAGLITLYRVVDVFVPGSAGRGLLYQELPKAADRVANESVRRSRREGGEQAR